MKKFFKSFVLALCSFSLFGCSGLHNLGDGSEEEPKGTEITFAEFLEDCEEITDKATEKVDTLTEINYTAKKYQDGKLKKSSKTRIGGSNGFSEFEIIECSSEKPEMAKASLMLTFAIMAMPAFGPLVDEAYKKALEQQEVDEEEEEDSLDAIDIVENGKFYIFDDGWLLETIRVDIRWNKFGFPVSCEGETKDDGETYYEIDTFSYKYSTSF